MSKKPVYRVAHIGINTAGEKEAQELAGLLCNAFCQEAGEENESHLFAGNIFEVMKHSRIGAHGHIALQADDVEAAMEDLSSKGVTFQEDTVRRDENGKITFIYLEQEFGGFQIHLKK